jgi:hypothetical protein
MLKTSHAKFSKTESDFFLIIAVFQEISAQTIGLLGVPVLQSTRVAGNCAF